MRDKLKAQHRRTSFSTIIAPKTNLKVRANKMVKDIQIMTPDSLIVMNHFNTIDYETEEEPKEPIKELELIRKTSFSYQPENKTE